MTLKEATDVPVRERIEAEVRLVRELEKALGGEDAVAEVYRAWVNASEGEASQIDSETARRAVCWPRAVNAATRAGFSKLGDAGEAHFELRLERIAMASRS